MRIRTPITVAAMSLVALAACGDSKPADDPSSKSSSGGSDLKVGSGDIKDGGKGGDTKGSSSGGGGEAKFECKGKPAVGKPSSTFSLPSLNGQGKLAVEKGKVTIVDFWATWCEPCKKSFPKYQELYVKYKASGLEIVAISVDDEKKEIPSFAQQHGAKFPVGWDEGHKVAGCWEPPNMPSAYVVDKQGVIRHVHNGYHDGEEKELEKEIKALF